MVLARKLRPLLYTTILFCCFSIILASFSLSARSWFVRTAQHQNATQSSINIEFGLFNGEKIKRFLGKEDTPWPLSVVCQGALCMFSCGLSGDQRKADISYLLENQSANDEFFCRQDQTKDLKFVKNGQASDDFENGFIHFGYWLATILLVSAGVMFSVIGGALALYNTIESPTQPIFGIFGLYIWNGCAASSSLMSLIVWGACYAEQLKDSGAISETIIGEPYNGSGTLGYCYWIMILPVLFNLSNLGILYYHSRRLRQTDRQIAQVIDDKLANGDNLLF